MAKKKHHSGRIRKRKAVYITASRKERDRQEGARNKI
jgi:hypothetical protein